MEHEAKSGSDFQFTQQVILSSCEVAFSRMSATDREIALTRSPKRDLDLSMSTTTLQLTEVRSHFGLSAAQSRDLGELYERMNKRRRLDDGANTDRGHVVGYGAWQQSYHGAQQGTPAAAGDMSSYADQSGYEQIQSTEWQQSYQPVAQYYAQNYPTDDSHQQVSATGQDVDAGYHSLWPTEVQLPGSLSNGVSNMHLSMNRTSASIPQGSQRAADTEDYHSVYAPDSLAFTHHSGLIPQAQHASNYYEDASMHLKLQSLPILDNLATQLIETIARSSFSHLQKLAQNIGSEESQPYIALKNLFDQTRKVYLRDTPFIDALAIHLFLPHQQDVIRKANIATLMSLILGAHDVSLRHLDTFFLATFVPLGQRLLKWQGAVYLELKTQAYISSLMSSEASVEDLLSQLFPEDLESSIMARHPDAPSLSPAEQDFADRCRARKAYLMAETASPIALQELPQKYQWSEFIRELAAACGRNVDSLLNAPSRAQGTPSGVKTSGVTMGGTTEKRLASHPARRQSKMRSPQRSAKTASPPSSAVQVSRPETSQASSSKGTPASTSGNSTRQPWTKPEEEALVAGLEQVEGPHWSQILALYGRGGSQSEALKDRNQVQLKDKARNLKLWYLKTGREVPQSLKGVTGELRKRGGARARAAFAAEEEGGEDVETQKPVKDGRRSKGSS